MGARPAASTAWPRRRSVRDGAFDRTPPIGDSYLRNGYRAGNPTTAGSVKIDGRDVRAASPAELRDLRRRR
jgi:hypothetical protein